MTTFDNREQAFENMYARDQELQFKLAARRNRLLGAWAAELLGKDGDEAAEYAKEVVRADFEEAGDEDVVRKLVADFQAAGVDVSDAQIREALDHNTAEARRQLIEDQG